jgi:hypothetical protein
MKFSVWKNQLKKNLILQTVRELWKSLWIWEKTSKESMF